MLFSFTFAGPTHDDKDRSEVGMGPNPDTIRKSLTYGMQQHSSQSAGFKFGSPVHRRNEQYQYLRAPPDKDERWGRYSTQGYHGYEHEPRQWGSTGFGEMPPYDPGASSTHPGGQQRRMQFHSYEGRQHGQGFPDPYDRKRKYDNHESQPKFDPYTGERLAPPSPKARFDPYTGKPIKDIRPPSNKKAETGDQFPAATVTKKPDHEVLNKKIADDEMDDFDFAGEADFANLVHSSTPNKPNQRRALRSTKESASLDLIDTFASEDKGRREEDLAEEREKEIKQAEKQIKKFKPFLTRRITESHLNTMKADIAAVQRYIAKSTPGPDSFFHAVVVFCHEYTLMEPPESAKRLRRQLALYMSQQEHLTSVSYIL